MKRLITITALIFFSNAGFSQVHQHTLGLRYGTGYGLLNSEFSYQLGLNQKNRIEFGLAYRQRDFEVFDFRQLSASMFYQHVMNIRGGFNWYVGAGLKYDFTRRHQDDASVFFHYFSVGPTVGLEYDFNKKNIPLVMAVDFRPSIAFIPGISAHYRDQFGLSLRYTFKDKPRSNE